jgi:hemerythrin-like metal-binding protein
MEFFRWKDQFSVNIPEMDQQHQKFFSLLNKVHLYNETQVRDPEFLNELFRELYSYVLTHFEEEEKLLEQTGLPGLEVQRKQHQYFRDQLLKLREQHFKGQATTPQSVLVFMRDWFMNHVLEFDKKYGDHFKNLPPQVEK